MKSNIYQALSNGKPTWTCDYKIEGRRVRRYFATRQEAEAHAEAVQSDIDNCGSRFARMDDGVKLSIERILPEIGAAGLTLETVWEYAKLWKAHLVSKAVKNDMTLREAIPAFIRSREDGECGARYIKNIRQMLNQFARGREEMLVNAITPAMCIAWHESKKSVCTAEVQRHDRNKLIVFCNWAIANHCMAPGTEPKKPTPAHHIPLRPMKNRRIEFLTVDESKAILEATAINAPQFLVYLTLCLFSGVRPEGECYEVTFDMIDTDEGLLKLPPEVTKTNSGRNAYLPACAIAWLELAKQLGFWGEKNELVAPSRNGVYTVRRDFWLPHLASGRWPQDVLRHTTATYRYGMTDNLGKVGKELGNTPDVLEDHYIAHHVSRAKAEAFYAITPAADLLEKARAARQNIVAMKAA